MNKGVYGAVISMQYVADSCSIDGASLLLSQGHKFKYLKRAPEFSVRCNVDSKAAGWCMIFASAVTGGLLPARHAPLPAFPSSPSVR